MGIFEIKEVESGGFHFVLKASNGQVILSSQVYAGKSGAENGVESVKKNCFNEDCYERKTATNNKPYFNLKSTNGQIIGTSQMYVGESGMENGIDSVKQNATDADIVFLDSDISEEE